jgi:hypothetical protein
MVSTLCLVEHRQALSEPVSLDPRDRILSGIEYLLRAPQDIRCDVVFVKLAGFAGEELLPHVSEQARQPGPPCQRFDNALQFGPFRFGDLGSGIL